MKFLNKAFPILAIALVMTALGGCAATDTRSSTGEYLDDAAITTRVKAAILKHPDLRSAEINVETFRNVVQLSGFVSSQAEIDAAVELVQTVSGVQSVRNDMQLR